MIEGKYISSMIVNPDDTATNADKTIKLPSLRQMLMELNVKGNTTLPLFHCIGMAWHNSKLVIFHSPPQCLPEVNLMVANVIHFLTHKYGPLVYQCFTYWTVSASVGATYDLET